MPFLPAPYLPNFPRLRALIVISLTFKFKRSVNPKVETHTATPIFLHYGPMINDKSRFLCQRHVVLTKRKNPDLLYCPFVAHIHPRTRPTMGRLSAKSDYEELREARIVENQARLASLGLQKTITELRSLNSSPKSDKTHVRKCNKVDYSSTPLRRSSRLTGKPPASQGELRYFSESDEVKGNRNGSVRAKRGLILRRISEEALARRCESKGRGSLYDPVYGICCHFCRQKKLCGEEDCKRCGDLDMDQPCIGKTDCSVCHSTNGILCRACLKVRYGEEMEEVRSNKEWMCPHCMEEKGINPYWICNSSFCLKKRKMVPTGIAIFRAREMGYKSVAHLLMAELQRAEKKKIVNM